MRSVGPLKRTIVEALLLLVLILVTTVAVRQVNRILSEKMEVLQDDGLARLEAWLDRKITYESISPSIFMCFEVKGLRIFPAADPGQPLLELPRLKIHYNIIKLISHGDPLESISRVEIFDSQIAVDRDRDEEIYDLVTRFGEASASPLDFKVQGNNMRVLLRSDSSSLALTDLFFVLTGGRDGLGFSIRKASASAVLHTAAEEPFAVRSSFRMKGTLAPDFDWFDAQVQLHGLFSDSFSIGPQALHVALSERRLTVRRLEDRAAIDLQVLWDLDARELTAELRTEDFRVARLATFRGGLAFVNDWSGADLTCDGRIRYGLDTRKLSYDMNVRTVLSHESLPVDLSLSSSFFGDETRISLKPLWLVSEAGALYFSGDIGLDDFQPQGTIKILGIEAFNGQTMDASLLAVREEGAVRLHGESLVLGGAAFTDFALELLPQPDRIDFSFSSGVRERSGAAPAPGAMPEDLYLQLAAAGSVPARRVPTETAAADPAETGRVSGAGTLIMGTPPVLRLTGRVQELPSGIVTGLFSRGSAEGSFLEAPLAALTVSSAFTLQTDFQDLNLSSPQTVVEQSARPENRLNASFELRPDRLEVKRVLGSWEGVDLCGTMYAASEPEDGASFFAAFSVQGIPYHAYGRYEAGGQLTLTGSHGLEGSLQLSGEEVAFDLACSRMPLPVSSVPLLVSLSVSGSTRMSLESTSFQGRAEAYDLPIFRSSENTLRLHAAFRGGEADIKSVVYEDEFSLLAGSGKLGVSGPGEYTGAVFLSRGGEAEESLAAQFGWKDGELALECEFTGTPLDRYVETTVAGALSGRLAASGRPEDPELAIQAALVDGLINTDPVSAAVELSYDTRRYEIDKLNIIYMGSRISGTRGWYDKPSGDFQLRTHLRSGYLDDALDTDIDVSGNMGEAAIGPERRLFDNAIRATARLRNISFAGEQRRDWLVRLFTENGVLRFNGGLDETLSGYLTSNTEFALRLEKPFPLRGHATGRVVGNQLQAEARGFELDFTAINEFTGGTYRFLQGLAYGDLAVTGFIGDPDFSGKLKADDVVVSFHMAPDVTESVSTVMTASEKELSFEIPSFRAGRAEIAASGVLVFSHWVPVGFDIDFLCSDDTRGLHVVHDFGPMVVDGYVSGAARVWGDAADTWVDGNLEINYCRVTLSEPSEEEQEEESRLNVQLMLTTGKRVEFLWPSVSFPVIRAYADKGAQVFVAYASDTEETIVQGNMGLRGGEVFYFDRSFYIKEGAIEFNENLLEFDPRITVRSEVRERDENNEEVKIYLVVEGDKLSEFAPRFESQPAKSDLEILALLGGPIREQIEQSGLQVSALLLSSDILSQFGILRPLEQRVREALRLDLFSIRTQVIQNMILLGLLGNIEDPTLIRILGLRQNPDDRAQDRPGRYLDNTTITFGKYIGNDLFLEMLLRLTAGGTYDLQSEMLLSLEWPTPFFDLEWAISPSGESLDEFLLNDNRLTLQWRYSY